MQFMYFVDNLLYTIIYIRDKNSCNFFGTHDFACSNCSAVLVPVLRPINIQKYINNTKLYYKYLILYLMTSSCFLINPYLQQFHNCY